jgi:hypothetical protein
MKSNGEGCSFPSFPVDFLENAIMTVLRIESNILVYFRRMEMEVRVYKETGQAQPGDEDMRVDMKCLEPWKREMWLGWEEIPEESKVIRMSIVAVGGLRDLVDWGLEREGANAEERREEIFWGDQVVVMESRKSLRKVVSFGFGRRRGGD